MGDAVARLQAEGDGLQGVIVTSAKKTFVAGGDLRELLTITPENIEEMRAVLTEVKSQFRALETLGKPVVACIAGSALGGGWEIALSCHHRIALDDDRIEIGLPEVTLGLLPGAGGIVRTVRSIGLEKALPLLLEGKQLRPKEAHALGLLHELAPDAAAMLERARAWIQTNPQSAQPWDTKGYAIPGGTPSHPTVAQLLAIAPSILRERTKGNFPAPEAILCAAVEGAQVDFDTAQAIELRYFSQVVTGPIAKNMIHTFWFQLNSIKAGRSRPKGFPPSPVKKVGVLGAGMMGSGIAYVSAAAGIDVILKDVSKEGAEKGKAYSTGLLDKKLARGQTTQERRDAILDRIQTTDRDADFTGCDLLSTPPGCSARSSTKAWRCSPRVSNRR